MAEANPLLAMADRLMAWVNRRLSEHVRLVRVGTTPAEPADGWAIAVGGQRVALGGSATAADTGWLDIEKGAGVSGSPQVRQRDGWVVFRGGAGSSYTNVGIWYTIGAIPAGVTLPSVNVHYPVASSTGPIGTLRIVPSTRTVLFAPTAEGVTSVPLSGIPPLLVED